VTASREALHEALRRMPSRRRMPYSPPLGSPWLQPLRQPIHRASVWVVYRGPGVVHAANARRRAS
jgi:hypothetical protein